MGQVVVVTSGKGGVGKTTSTAALGAALAQEGQKVVVVDFDVGLRNLDLVMGAERRVVFDLINVIHGVAKLQQALIRDKRLDNLCLLPASQTRDKDALTENGVARVIAELRTKFDWIICDSPAGIERGATLAMRNADAAIIVTNPEVSSVRDSDRIIGLLDSKTAKAERGERVAKHLLITRYSSCPRGTRRNALDRRRARNPVDPAAWDHSRERRSASRLKRRGAGDPEQHVERPGCGIFRGGAPPQRRRRSADRAERKPKHSQPVIWTESGMSLFNFFRRGSAPVARERLQILLAHERTTRGQPDLLGVLREEILAVISRHISFEPDKVQIKMDRGKSVSTLEVDIEIPNGLSASFAAAQ